MTPEDYAASMSDGALVEYFAAVFRDMDAWDLSARMYGVGEVSGVFAADTRQAILDVARLVARDVMRSND